MRRIDVHIVNTADLKKTELNFCCCIYSVRGNVGTHPINMKVMIGSTVGGLCATYVYSVIFVSLCPEALFHLLYRNPSFLLQDELNCSFLFSDKENHNSCIFQQQVCACYLQRGTIHTLKKKTHNLLLHMNLSHSREFW